MEDLNDKITGGNLTAAEWNQVPSEIQNVIENLGQTLSGGDVNQLGKSIAGYAANGTFYTDSGAADAYVATVIGLKQNPTAYTDGLKSTFRVSATNTGASTVNVATLGAKNIFYRGSALVGGELTVGLIVDLVFDSGNDRFDLVPNLSNTIAVDGGWVIGSPSAGSLGAGTLNIQNQLSIGASTDPGIAFHIEHATEEKMRLESTSITGNSLISFYQTTTLRAFIQYADTLDDLRMLSGFGRVSFWTDTVGGTNLRGYFESDGGLVVGAPTGASNGVGTINAQAVYDDNVLLTCYVFDTILDGSARLDKWDSKVANRVIPATVSEPKKTIVRKHEPLRKFREKMKGQYNPLNIDSYSQHWKDKRHLTSMPNEKNYDIVNGAMATGEWIQRLIETVEIQAVHISTLNDRLKAAKF